MKTVNHLGTDPIGKLVPRIAFPSMLAQFVSVLYSIVDRMYIGHIASVGDLALQRLAARRILLRCGRRSVHYPRPRGTLRCRMV